MSIDRIDSDDTYKTRSLRIAIHRSCIQSFVLVIEKYEVVAHVYGFGGEPGKSFALGDAVIAFALPSALAAAAKKPAALAQRARVK